MPERRRVPRLLIMLLVFLGLAPVVFFSVVELGLAESTGNADSVNVDIPGNIDREVVNDAFGVGEKLTFDIRYGFISAGTASMEVARLVEFEGRPCYQLVTRANSNSFFSTFYKVEDKVESIVDAVGMFSWRFEKNLREGNYRADRLQMFDQRNRRVTDGKDTVTVPPFVQDALSTLFFVRTQPLEVGKSVWLDNFVDGKLYKLEVKVEGRETVSVAAGTFDCLVVEPITQSVGLFKHEGRLKVWLTDDRLRMPVLMKSKIVVGSITAELTGYELGQVEEL